MINTNDLKAGVETLIHIGPGSHLRLEDYLNDRFGQVLIIEPERECAAQLADEPRLQVVHGVLAHEEGEGELLRWNLERLSSLKQATPLLFQLLPGSRIIATQPVPLITPSRLLAAAWVPFSSFHLVIAFSGEEQEILAMWKAEGLLAQTRSIELRTAEEELFVGAEPRAAIERWLNDEGFALAASDTSDPDWPVLQFEADVTHKAVKAAQEKIAALEQTLGEQQAREAEALAAHDEALAQARAANEASSAREAELQQTLSDAQERTKEKGERIAALEGELKALGDKAEWRQKRIEELEKVVGEKEVSLAKADQQSQQAYSDLGVAARMQALLQADLKDLRARYEILQEIRVTQEALLRKLTPQLQQAADQLRHLQLSEHKDNPLAVAAVAPLLERENGSPRKSRRARSKRV